MARLTLAFLHYHHSFLLDSGSPTAQGHDHSVSLGWGAAGAGGPVVQDARPDGATCELCPGWDKQGAALAETQLVVHCHRVASGCCHTLSEWQKWWSCSYCLDLNTLLWLFYSESSHTALVSSMSGHAFIVLALKNNHSF